MAPKSAFAGGYNEATAKKLEKIHLPDKIKCKGCGKFRMKSAYSKKQLNDLRHKIYVVGELSATVAGQIKCRTCTGQQVNELTCTICDEVKGLEGFSKVQRRDPDKARCLTCVNVQGEMEAGLELGDEDDFSDSSSNPFDSDEDDYFDSEIAAPIPGMRNLSLSKSSTHASVSGISDRSGYVSRSENMPPSRSNLSPSIAGGVSVKSSGSSQQDEENASGWQEVPRSALTTRTQQGIPFTGYDAQGRGHARVRPPSTVSERSSRSGTSTTSRQSAVRQSTVSNNRGFAKVKASAIFLLTGAHKIFNCLRFNRLSPAKPCCSSTRWMRRTMMIPASVPPYTARPSLSLLLWTVMMKMKTTMCASGRHSSLEDPWQRQHWATYSALMIMT
ncbi:hypothetical protein L228DRAFT_250462 [Xylona heveae TC161]|uniref:Stc1 domain-containing protein n=1 Tax=Xylona heveae (strain CBS 132557 / TC161) TaxID=1328760 RepID=A0A165A6T3_XYLHT|nr:hypothetical protein L228DRAFT_250462 [Xylona heveae TC161]KZF20033.1 hypothetical protein L228DRAFT_250462 [Xylona heveae TC161]